MCNIKLFGNLSWAILFFFTATLAFSGCGDVSKAPAPIAGPGPLTILTSSPLPDGTVGQFYNVTLASSGGTPPFTWSLAAGSPSLPTGLNLDPSTGAITGTPTTAMTRSPIFKVQDSTVTPQSNEKTLQITINLAPIPLAIITNSLPSGTINQPYAFALSPNGGTTPYTWGLKAGSPPLPSGLTLNTSGIISGTPTVTSNVTHTFTLTDATTLTVEKSLQLSISAVPLSITTASLPQGTANQNYSATLNASGGTGAYTWGLTGGSQPLPTGLALNSSTGVISGIPTSTSNVTPTFSVSDQTPPAPQTATKQLQLIIGAAPATLTITTGSPLVSGTVTQAYNVTLNASGGTGTQTWDIASGSLPVGLTLSSSGVISGTPTTAGTSSPTFRVRDSGSPQQTATKVLSITINNPAPPTITTTSLPNGSFNQAYNQTLGVSGGIAPLTWGVIAGGLPTGLTLNSSTGTISGTATATGTFNFTVRVTDAIPQFDDQALSITVVAPALSIITSSPLPAGTVNQTYPGAILQAAGGTPPFTWDPVVSPALPNGLTWTAATATISGIPLAGSEGTANHAFTVRDSTNPVQMVQKALSLTINAAAPTLLITSTSPLPSGTVGLAYSTTLTATGGTPPLTWSLASGSPALPSGLTLTSDGVLSGTPTTATTVSPIFRVQDSAVSPQSNQKTLSITINAAPTPLTITTTSPLTTGKVGVVYGPVILTASGGTPPYTWSSTVTPALPAGLTFDATTHTLSGTPTVSESNVSHTFSVQDSTLLSVNKALSLTINP